MLKIGTRVRVTTCSGVDSGKIGVVIQPIIRNGRPAVSGAYKPFRPGIESFILTDSGEHITMFDNRLEVLSHV